MRNKFLAFFLFVCATHLLEGKIHEHGFWYDADVIGRHATDYGLADGLVDFFVEEKANNVGDFGCGLGNYIRVLRYNHIDAEGYDGNPQTGELSEGMAKVSDLSQPVDFGKKYDWILCLEVGENLPKQYEKIFIENLNRHASKGMVLSWAVRDQGGYGHVNEQNNDYIKSVMSSYGYTNDLEAEKKLRNLTTLWWFKNSLMVFRKKQELQ